MLIVATQVTTRLVDSPYTETQIPKAYGVAYMIEVERKESSGSPGTYEAGQIRVWGHVYGHESWIGERMFPVTDVDLVVYYCDAAGDARKRTFKEVAFLGRAEDTASIGGVGGVGGVGGPVKPLFGVPFVVQVGTKTLSQVITDEDA